MLVLISVLYMHCSRIPQTLASIPMYLYSTMIFWLSICFSCGIKLTKLNPVCVFDVIANTKRVNASMTRCQYFLWWSVFIQSSYCVNVKRFVHRSNLLQKYLLFHLELCVCHVSPCNVTLFANSWILDVIDVNGVKFKIIFEIPICAWTDSSLFSCHYQCQLLTKLNPVVVFDVVAHTKRLNASIVCCRYYFVWSVFIQSSYRVNVNDAKRFFCRIDLSIDLYLLTDFVDFYIDSGWFLDSELIENIF